MKTIPLDLLIIGGGLTGLSIAYYLSNSNFSIGIVEARERLGGRIHTDYEQEKAPLEMGATWFSNEHNYLANLLDELQLQKFVQQFGKKAIYEPISTSPHQIVTLPPNSDPSYRIKGGSSSVINALKDSIDHDNIFLGEFVKSIDQSSEGLSVKSNHYTFNAKKVVSTLPPNLLNSTIEINPGLPQLTRTILEGTHTWMGESIKIGLRYKSPFWREENLSGTIFSNVGPIPEMYDHSNFKDTSYGLKGFLNSAYYSISKEARLEKILNQLRKYYGKHADEFIDYKEVVWRDEKFTHVDYESHILPHQNNGHSIYQETYMNDKLFIAGSETSTQFPGYMEGAVRSAKLISQRVLQS